jgi:hypothetical protein
VETGWFTRKRIGERRRKKKNWFVYLLRSPPFLLSRRRKQKDRAQYKLKHNLIDVEEGGDVILRKPGHLYGYRKCAVCLSVCL